ncbi:MAG: hypothetical protein KC561_14365, partial [Myxococcales bacterium]|nr:hypothetical protein [Myxococcales bacterium]
MKGRNDDTLMSGMFPKRFGSWTTVLCFLCGLPATSWSGNLVVAADVDRICETSAPELPEETTELEVLDACRARSMYAVQLNQNLLDVYRAAAPGYRLTIMRQDSRFMDIDVSSPIPLFDSSILLDLGPTAELSFPLTEEEMQRVEDAQAAEDLVLQVSFVLAARDDSDLAYCVSDEMTTTVSARLLTAELITRSSKTILASVETERFQRERVLLSAGSEERDLEPPLPRVIVSNVTRVGGMGSTDPAEWDVEQTYLSTDLEGRALGCYSLGLQTNGRLQGALVTEFEITSDGAISSPQVLIDALAQPV